MVHNSIYTIAITGPIGVGKSTVFNLVLQYFRSKGRAIATIREYIDGPNANLSQALLEQYLAGKLSDASFQNYIQSYYINQLEEDFSNKIVIMERTMSDSVAIFCNKANRLGKLSDLEFTLMYNNCIDVDKKVDAPNYFIKNLEFTSIKTDDIETTAKSVIDVIERDLASGVKSRLIGLYNSPDVCYQRVLIRSRTGESAYSLDSLKENCYAYDQLYKLIEEKNRTKIRLFDLGGLYTPE